jgi:hypothetical protein
VQEDAVDGEQADAVAEVAHEVRTPELVEQSSGRFHDSDCKVGGAWTGGA